MRTVKQALDQDAVHLWWVLLESFAGRQRELYKLLDDGEKLRAARFFQPADASAFIVRRGVLRLLLAGYLDLPPQVVTYNYNPQGKPELFPGDNLQFNLAKTGGMALIGITRLGMVGVDLEKRRTDLEFDQIARAQFSLAENALMESLPAHERAEAFFTIWTLKEAYLKAVGLGMSQPTQSFSVIWQQEGFEASLEGKTAAGDWHLWRLEAPEGYSAALALDGIPMRTQSFQANLSLISE